MRKVKTQFGKSMEADFEKGTWTFVMPEKYEVWAGSFAIVDKQVYDEIIQIKEVQEILKKIEY